MHKQYYKKISAPIAAFLTSLMTLNYNLKD